MKLHFEAGETLQDNIYSDFGKTDYQYTVTFVPYHIDDDFYVPKN